jgi:hypothetical protein
MQLKFLSQVGWVKEDFGSISLTLDWIGFLDRYR